MLRELLLLPCPASDVPRPGQHPKALLGRGREEIWQMQLPGPMTCAQLKLGSALTPGTGREGRGAPRSPRRPLSAGMSQLRSVRRDLPRLFHLLFYFWNSCPEPGRASLPSPPAAGSCGPGFPPGTPKAQRGRGAAGPLRGRGDRCPPLPPGAPCEAAARYGLHGDIIGRV